MSVHSQVCLRRLDALLLQVQICVYQSDSIEPDESHHARAAAVGNQPAVDQQHLQGATPPAAVAPAVIAPKVAHRCYWCCLAYAAVSADVSG